MASIDNPARTQQVLEAIKRCRSTWHPIMLQKRAHWLSLKCLVTMPPIMDLTWAAGDTGAVVLADRDAGGVHLMKGWVGETCL